MLYMQFDFIDSTILSNQAHKLYLKSIKINEDY